MTRSWALSQCSPLLSRYEVGDIVQASANSIPKQYLVHATEIVIPVSAQ